MNKYESVIIVNPSLDDDKVKALQDNFTKRKFDSFNPLNVTKVLQTLYFFVKFLFFSCTMSHNVI